MLSSPAASVAALMSSPYWRQRVSSVSPWLIRSLMASLRVWRYPADFALSWCLKIAVTVRGLGVKDIFMVKPHFVV